MRACWGYGLQNVTQPTTRMAWEGQPEKVKAQYGKVEGSGRIQSTVRHVEPCGKSGGPPPKAKYSSVTDSAKYCEGTVKRTPGGE